MYHKSPNVDNFTIETIDGKIELSENNPVSYILEESDATIGQQGCKYRRHLIASQDVDYKETLKDSALSMVRKFLPPNVGLESKLLTPQIYEFIVSTQTSKGMVSANVKLSLDILAEFKDEDGYNTASKCLGVINIFLEQNKMQLIHIPCQPT